MKKHKIHWRHLTGISFMLLLIISCQSGKLLNLQKDRVQIAAQEKTLINREQQEFRNHNRVISFSDSSDQTYQIRILPADSFSFSIRDGFKGKAASIDIYGKQRSRKNLSDSSAQYIQSHGSEKTDISSRYSLKQKKNLKVKEKESKMMGYVILLGMLAVIVMIIKNEKLKIKNEKLKIKKEQLRRTKE